MNNNFKYLFLTVFIGFVVIATYYIITNTPNAKSPIGPPIDVSSPIFNEIDKVRVKSGYNPQDYLAINNKIDANFQNGILTETESVNLISHSNSEQYEDIKIEIELYLKKDINGNSESILNQIKSFNLYSNKIFNNSINGYLSDIKYHDYFLVDFYKEFQNFYDDANSNCLSVDKFNFYRNKNADMPGLKSQYYNLSQFTNVRKKIDNELNQLKNNTNITICP